MSISLLAEKLSTMLSISKSATRSSASNNENSQDDISQRLRTGSLVRLISGQLAPHVVIIGGGYAGSLLARGLADAVRGGMIRLTVIDRRDFMHHKIAAFRTGVTADENWISRSQIPLENVVKYGRIVRGEVEEICEQTKTILFKDQNQQPITFDILVAATGSIHLNPGELPAAVQTADQVVSYFKSMASAIFSARKIIIVGAGPSAIELAGEIRSKYPSKEITLITASSAPMSSCVSAMPHNFHLRLRKKLEDLNIKVIYRERVVFPPARDFQEQRFMENVAVRTQGDRNLTIQSDLVLWASSSRTKTDMFPSEWLNELGELNVNTTFQLRTRKDVFAFGDVTSIPETKQAITLPSKVPILVHNIVIVATAIANGRFACATTSLKGLRTYRLKERELIYLPLGPSMGLSQIIWGFTFGDGCTARWKGKDLMTNYFWRLLTGSKPRPALKPLQCTVADRLTSGTTDLVSQ